MQPNMPARTEPKLHLPENVLEALTDGDTIHVTDSFGTEVTVRLYGIDCPETEKSNKRTGHISKKGQPCGEDAWKAFQGKLKRQQVRLDVMGIDRCYGRIVCIVWLDNRNINLVDVVQEG